MADLSLPKRLLHWYAIFVAASVVVLICSGGLVTSHGAGMAVPDWPNSFGYNMFLFPLSRWVGGVFFEHTHRLIASLVGLLTIGLCVLTLVVEKRRWVKWLAGFAVLAVVLQGILGGLRVTEHNAILGLFHGCLAQGFFCLVATIALVTSRFWRQIEPAADSRAIETLRFWTIAVTGMLIVQLALGASMRHSHTGLSIPDFPAAYGGILPPLDAASVARINEARAATQAAPPITAGPDFIAIRPSRMGGFDCRRADLCGHGHPPEWPASGTGRVSRPKSGSLSWLSSLPSGAWTIWSNKAADVATSHVFVGALTLMIGVLLSVILSAMLCSTRLRNAPTNLREEVARA